MSAASRKRIGRPDEIAGKDTDNAELKAMGNEKTLFLGMVSEDEKKELDAAHKQYKLGKSKSYTVAEVRKQAYSKLKK